MIPQALFNYKCLHPDRDLVFKDDLNSFYFNYLLNIFSEQLIANKSFNSDFNFNKQVIKESLILIKSNIRNKINKNFNNFKFNIKKENEDNKICATNISHNINNLIIKYENQIIESINRHRINVGYTVSLENPIKCKSNKFEIEEVIKNLIYDKNNSNCCSNNSETNYLLFQNVFKKTWKDNRISLIHLSKYKEENTIEYYQLLYKEIQLYLFTDNNYCLISKLFSLYCMYSMYYTQPYEIKYQITTIPECLQQLNNLLSSLKELIIEQDSNIDETYLINFNTSVKQLYITVYEIIKKLYQDEAFKLGVILGLKTIILNKYGIPIDLKSDIYSEYKGLFNSIDKLEETNKKKQQLDSHYFSHIKNYKSNKSVMINNIKALFNLGCQENNNNKYNIEEKQLYCNKLNELKNTTKATNKTLSYINNEYTVDDLSKKVTKLDLNLNKFDYEINN